MITPAVRSEGATRRFVVHAAHETRAQGRVVRAVSFQEAALAYAEAWRPIPDPNGVIQLSLTDLDSGEQQDATIEVARPGVADLQVRRARLEMRVSERAEPPPGAERFRADPVEPLVIATERQRPRNYSQLAMNAAALVAVVIVSFLVVNRLTRDRFSEAPWEQSPPVAERPAPELKAAVLLRPSAQPTPPSTAAPAAAAPAPARTAYLPPRAAPRQPAVRNIPMDQLGPTPPRLDPAGAVAAPARDSDAAPASPAPAAPSEPLVVRGAGQDEALGSPSSPAEAPADDLTERLNQALGATGP